MCEWLYDPANKQQAIDILVKHAKQDPQGFQPMAYDYLVAKLKLFGLDGDVSDADLREDGGRAGRYSAT